ncbi:MAG TPA: DUF2652 domain-containing protein [Anaerolineales bacterium]|nr:DUF2652 domain-containing protein [Anaerolineales bacterium]
MATSQSGYLLIADITGYTLYLSQSELEHAQAILTVLLELLVEHTRPPLVISRLAGDAVISYGLQNNFYQGQTFLEMIEDTYVSFRKAIERMVLNNTCQCNACANISTLDLKFFVHYGTFGIQRIGEHAELVGSDVNQVHRLLKNQVTEKTKFRAYTLYTHAAIQQLNLTEISHSMTPHTEAYEHLGEVNTWVQDMHPVWEAKRAATQITIPPKQIGLQVHADIDLSPELVWDYLIRPETRKIILGSDRTRVINLTSGRITEGSVFQCFHGDQFVAQTILEWRPFERMVTQDLLPVPVPNTTCLTEFRLDPIESGTRLYQVFSKARGPLAGRLLADAFISSTAKQTWKDIKAFKEFIEKEHAVRSNQATVVESSA